jgi:tetratricopeptide (TPR) repeat protein
MGVDRKNPDPALKIRQSSAIAPTPPLVTRRATPPQLPAVRPPPPPVRVKRTDDIGATSGSTAPTAAPRNLSPFPADIAFARTLPVTTPGVTPPVAPEPPTVEPAVAQIPANEAALSELPRLSEAIESHPATTTQLAGLESAAMPRRVRTSRLIGIAAGAILGVAGAAYFGTAGIRATPLLTARPAPLQAAALPAADPITAQAPATAEAPPIPAAILVSQVSPLSVTPPASTAPSCQELLGSAYEKKRDPAAAFDQTRLGQRELVRGNVAGTQQAFCTAALWDETNAERWLNLGQIFLIRRDGAKAADCARTALALQPNSTRALTMLGDASAMLGNAADARQAYLSAENRSDPDPAALRLMTRRDMEEAQRMVKRRDFARAERLFRRVMMFDAEHAEARAGLATCLTKLQSAR